MLYMITGGSGSGKSEYAEEKICRLCTDAGGGTKLYVATMIPYGKETKQKIARHRKIRAEKAFVTEECYTDLYGFAETRLREWETPPFVLLECMSNLIANEMFAGTEEAEYSAGEDEDASDKGSSGEKRDEDTAGKGSSGEKRDEDAAGKRSFGEKRDEDASDKGSFGETTETDAAVKVIRGIRHLMENCRDVVIVTNEVCSESAEDTPEMQDYKRILGRVNCWMAEQAAEVTEVVYGIPHLLKENAGTIGKGRERISDDWRKSKSVIRSNGKEIGMKLIIGGAFQGKLEYGRAQYPGIRWIDGTDCEFHEIFECEGMNHFDAYIRRLLRWEKETENGARPADEGTGSGVQLEEEGTENGACPAEEGMGSRGQSAEEDIPAEYLPELLREKNPGIVLIGNEIGSGLVPVDAFERYYRERYGRICTQLAQQAERVDRVICGIGVRLKDDGNT